MDAFSARDPHNAGSARRCVQSQEQKKNTERDHLPAARHRTCIQPNIHIPAHHNNLVNARALSLPSDSTLDIRSLVKCTTRNVSQFSQGLNGAGVASETEQTTTHNCAKWVMSGTVVGVLQCCNAAMLQCSPSLLLRVLNQAMPQCSPSLLLRVTCRAIQVTPC